MPLPQPHSVPRRLYHYTSTEGLIGIIANGHFRATEISYMNDTTEGAYGRQIVSEVVNARLQSASEPEALVLNQILRFLERNESIFAVCFCEKSDLLSQWNGYGSLGGGYEIEMDTTALVEFCEVQSSTCTLVKVEYERGTMLKQVDKLIDEWVSSQVAFADPGNPSEYLNGHGAGLTITFAQDLGRYATSVKNPVFEGESEWRLLVHDPYSRPYYKTVGDTYFLPRVGVPAERVDVAPVVATTTDGRRLAPRPITIEPKPPSDQNWEFELEHDPPCLPVTGIRVGPTTETSIAVQGVQRLLNNYGYSSQNVEVRESEVPLRSLL